MVVVAWRVLVPSLFALALQFQGSAGIRNSLKLNKIQPATSVRMAWGNHFQQFAAMDEEKIMADYDQTSVVAIYNDACTDPLKQLVAEYTGLDEIKDMFTALFQALGRNISNVKLDDFSKGGGVNPHCEPEDTSLPASSNVFLVWSAAGKGITYATDTFTWKTGYKVKKQNIVVTEPGAVCSATKSPQELDLEHPITKGWLNHFQAFANKNVQQIMMDYTEDSVIRIWDNTVSVYSAHTGLEEIAKMFTGLFAAITAAADNGDEGIKAPLVSVTPQYNSVFLVWQSFSNPKATDTFIFDDEGTIIRQNIVTNSNSKLSGGDSV